MKKAFLCFLVLFAAAWLFASPVYDTGGFSAAMGNTGMSSFSEILSYRRNPAALGFRTDSALMVTSFALCDTVCADLFASEAVPEFDATVVCGELAFVGKNIAIGVSLGSALARSGPGADSSYHLFDFTSITDLFVNFSYAREHLSLGLRLDGGNGGERKAAKIHENSPLTDYLLQSLFAEHPKKAGSEYFSACAGAILKLDRFSLGLYFDELTDPAEPLKLNRDVMKKTMDIGFTWFSSPYLPDLGGLRPVVTVLSLESHALLSVNRSIRSGIGFKAQLSDLFSATLAAGFESGNTVRGFFTEGTLTAGAQIRYEGWSASLSLLIPVYTSEVTIRMGGTFSI